MDLFFKSTLIYLYIFLMLQFWKYRLTSIRARIFVFYTVLIIFVMGISVPLMIKFVFNEIDDRVTDDLVYDVELFRELVKNTPWAVIKLRLEREYIPYLERPQQLFYLFNLYLTHRTPEDDTYLITVVNAEPYRSSPEALPPGLTLDSSLVRNLSRLEKPTKGRTTIAQAQTGDVLYIVEPIYDKSQQQVMGRLIAVHVVDGERQEALVVLHIVFGVMGGVFLLSLVATWWVAGGTLSPVSAIISSVHSINDRDWSRRITVRADGELGDLARSFNDMLDRLSAAFVSQQQFLNDAGHELRTPITIVRGHLELMLLDTTAEADVETLTLVIDELDRMSRLVNDLMLLAKSERPDFLILKPIDFSSFVAELFVKIQALEDRNWHLEVDGDGTIVGDYQRLTQAVVNLAQNAVQHTCSSDSITLGASLTHQSFALWVSDTGEGIPEAEQTRIFERFARVRYTQRRSDGSGLGLAIVKRIVEAHQGKILLESKPTIGSTFRLVFPLNAHRILLSNTSPNHDAKL
ncbi:MAG TPA: ATP-binding protein [Stenomitos sp.]